MRKLAVVLALLLVVSDASAKKKTIQTGDPLPKKPVVSKKCHDKGAVRIIGSEPSTPFATVKGAKIDSAGEACCAQWARKGTKWSTVDSYGQVVGEATLTGGEGYDVTQCYELSFSTKKGKPGVGLYIDGPYTAPKSAVWTPSDIERASLAKLVTSLEAGMVPNAPYPCDGSKALPLGERTLFFHIKDDTKAKRFAIVGGPLMILARLQDDGRWVARDVDAFGSNTCMPRAYQPRAVFDLNGDGKPEIVMHQDVGDSFGDYALGLEEVGMEGRWVEVAVAIHGSTA